MFSESFIFVYRSVRFGSVGVRAVGEERRGVRIWLESDDTKTGEIKVPPRVVAVTVVE